MPLRTSIPVLGLALVLVTGYTIAGQNQSPDTHKVLVEGHGRANSSLRVPGESFMFRSVATGESFRVVPEGKNLIVTDVMFIAQGSLEEDIAVNLSRANAAGFPPQILFQVRISPGESHDVHLCSGYIIPAGHSLVTYTGGSAAPGQYVSVAVSGYLATH